MTTQPLKPCPFCGGKEPYVTQLQYGSFRIVCSVCGVEGPYGNKEDRAIEGWNQRCKPQKKQMEPEIL